MERPHAARILPLSLLITLGTLAMLPLLIQGQQPTPGLPSKVGPFSPREELATFQVAPGFKVELVAAEPEVIDPVAMCFDEDGRLFVVEMRGYPNGGIGEGQPNLPGRVKLLEDANGDGYYEKATVFVDNLRFPTGVCVWHGGIFVANAPEILYCKDTDGDGKADIRQMIFTGFGQKNIQQLVNGLQFQFDNFIHGCNGSNESIIRWVDKQAGVPGVPGKAEAPRPEAGDSKPPAPNPAAPSSSPSVVLRGRHFRFKPDNLSSFEPMSGGGQYGLASDDTGNWFTCTNSQHLRHIVLPDYYLKRNPHLPVPAVVTDIPDGGMEHTAAAKVFRVSPFEAWRVERTSRRVKDPNYNKRLPATELVPGGYITSATGLVVYRGGRFPAEFEGNVFVCDPANNLIHRDVLLPVGATFIAKRHEQNRDCEFLASTDNWFRPVFLTQGPDGALYLADFYREVIETPLSLPEDIQKQYNLNSRERGRIWRITAAGQEAAAPAKPPRLSKASNEDLVAALENANSWWRLQAQRLLSERKANDAIDSLARLAHTSSNPLARIHALWTLEGLGALEDRHVGVALRDRSWKVREQALRLSEQYYGKSPAILKAALALINDPTPRVRFQLALSLGEAGPDGDVAAALATLAEKDGSSPWVQSAILSSALPHAGSMMAELAASRQVPPQFLARLAGIVAATGDEQAIAAALTSIARGQDRTFTQQCQVLEGLAQGLARQGRPLSQRMTGKSEVGAALTEFLTRAGQLAVKETASTSERLAAVRLLGHAPAAMAMPWLARQLAPQTSPELQLAAVQALSLQNHEEATRAVLAAWSTFSPTVRREAQEVLFARADRLPLLLAALEKGELLGSQLDLERREQLLKHANAGLRERAQKVFAGQILLDRRKVLEEHQKSLDLQADSVRGKAVFKKNCTTCHRLENEGVEVGPDLLSALKNKTRETLLVDILDPSREVDPRYLNYVVSDKNGQIFTGLVASETASSLVLRRAEKAENTLLRADIDAIRATSKSLMPEGLEKQISAQELADVIAYLLEVAGKK